jgi:hypothetical protein
MAEVAVRRVSSDAQMAFCGDVRIPRLHCSDTWSWLLPRGWSNFYAMLSGWKRDPEYQE